MTPAGGDLNFYCIIYSPNYLAIIILLMDGQVSPGPMAHALVNYRHRMHMRNESIGLGKRDRPPRELISQPSAGGQMRR
jgi:hypothetical protein